MREQTESDGNLVPIQVQSEVPITQTMLFTDSWLAGQLSSNTARAYAADIAQFLDFLGHDDLTAVRREDLFRYREWLVERYKPATINRKLSSIRQLMLEAVRHGVIEKNPADGLRGHKGEGNYSPTRSPAEGQVFALLDALNPPEPTPVELRDRALLYVMAGMGLRRHEVCLLTGSSITRDGEYTVLEVMGKGTKRRRLTVPPTVLEAVRAWQKVAHLPHEGPLFTSIKHNGQFRVTRRGLSCNGLYRIVKGRFAQVGIEGCSCHSLRHFFLRYARSRGASLLDMQEMAGHADAKTTMRYVREVDNLDASAARWVDF